MDGFRGQRAFLSNFYSVDIELDSEHYFSVEHAYQASKTLNPLRRKVIQAHPDPKVAKYEGNRVELRSNWNEIRVEVMKQLLRYKFFYHPDLATRLLDTGSEELVEVNDWGDLFWGTDRQGNGENTLGKLLMGIRSELQDSVEVS